MSYDHGYCLIAMVSFIVLKTLSQGCIASPIKTSTTSFDSVPFKEKPLLQNFNTANFSEETYKLKHQLDQQQI
jgi:hypothetical protein